MKRRDYFILPLVAGAFSFVSCEKKADDTQAADRNAGAAPVAHESVDSKPPAKEETVETVKDAVEAGEESVEKVVEQVEEIVKPLVAGSIDDVAKETGFAKFVPKGASLYLGMYDGAELVKKMRASKLGVFLEALAEEQGGSLDEVIEDPSFQQFATIAGEELFLAVGEDGPEQMKSLMELNDTLTFHQMKFYVKIMESLVVGNGLNSEIFEEENYLFEVMKEEANYKLFERAKMPALYAGFKVSDEDKRAALLGQIQSLADMMLEEQDVELLVPAESDKGNGFKGVTLKGKLLADQMQGEVEDMMVEKVGKATFEKYVKTIETKDVVMMAGSVDDYIVIFFGSSADQLKFSEQPAESILTNDDIAFAKSFADKDILGLIYSSGKMQEVAVGAANSLEYVALGFKAGLEESESFGDTRVLEVLLEDLAKCEKSLFSLETGVRLGLVAYLEDGFKMELFGGSNVPAQDFTSGRALASMTEGQDILFSANWASNPEYIEKLMEYTDSLGATSYQLAKQVSELDIEDNDFKEFGMGFQMFDGMFREDLLQVWRALRVDLAEGLGSESAIVVDINGELPTIPNIPKPILENGTIPRISYISTVDDREKLGQSWDKINEAAESLLAKASQMSGGELPMQRPFKSSNDGLTSYTFPIPMTHQNCTPAAVVSDELFFLTTSPDFTGELAKKYDKSKLADPGATMTLDFEVLTSWAQRWYDLVDKHGAEFLSKSEMDDFSEVKPHAEKLFEAMGELDYLKIHSRKEEGELRSSFHFKVK